jgi:hypothetical protein
MSRSRLRYWILFLEGAELLLQKESGLANFGAKLVSSLNGADLSFMNSVTGFVEQSAQISYRMVCSIF